MKAERWANEELRSRAGNPRGYQDTLRGTLLLRMATLGTLAKQRRHHPEGSLPSSKDSTRTSRGVFRNIGTSIIKKRKERALSLQGKLPAPSIHAYFALNLGAGGRSR